MAAKRLISHEDAISCSFKNDPNLAIEYLNEVFENGNVQECMVALRRVTDVICGISSLAKKVGADEKNIHRMLSEKGNPTLKTLLTVLRALGLKLIVSSESPERFNTIVVEASKYPIAEMMRRGWLPKVASPKKYAAQLLADLLYRLGLHSNNVCVAAYRQTVTGKESDPYAMNAWIMGTRLLCKDKLEHLPEYSSIKGDTLFLQEVIKFSSKQYGIKKVCSFLESKGIAIVIVPHLKKTYLDGGVYFWKGHPVIALTLRYDRVDSFWFTLLHELSHIVLGHITPETEHVIFDDLYSRPAGEVVKQEQEANRLAQEIELPEAVWAQYASDLNRAKISTMLLVAEQLGISPAIVAGRIRYARDDYRLLSQHVGAGTVRCLFPEAFPDAGN